MNGKANKQSIVTKPPLLNLYRDEAVVDTSFQQFEEINGPYLNNMLSPVYVQDLKGTCVFDKDGNKYHLEDNVFYKNDDPLFQASDSKFVRKEYDFNKYIAFDIDNSFDGVTPTAYAVFDGESNKVSFTYNGNTVTTERLFDEGTIIESRIRVFDDSAVLVLYYDKSNVEYVEYIRLKSDGTTVEKKVNAAWKIQQIKYSSGNAFTENTVIITDADPIIHIANPLSGVYGVSLINEYDTVLNSKHNGYITLVEVNGSVYNTIIPSSSSQPASQTTQIYGYFYAHYMKRRNSFNGTCLSTDGIYFYDYPSTGTIGDRLDIPASYSPEYTGDIVTIGNTQYKRYRYTGAKIYEKLWVDKSDSTVGTYTITGNHYNGNSYNETSEHTIELNYTVWGDAKYRSGFDNVEVNWTYDASNLQVFNIGAGYINSSTYVHSFEITTTSTATWLVAPTIFLDNGAMYSMWTFSVTNNSWYQLPVTSPRSKVVESADPLSFTVSGSSVTYTFNIRESFEVGNTANCVRSNSFASTQNFWQVNAKLCQNTALTPSAMYANSYPSSGYDATKNVETSSASYIEYMNSNACAFKYMPGSVNLMSFNTYPQMINYFIDSYNPTITTEGPIEDYVITTPKGFRVPLKPGSNFNLLINTTTAGTATVQGISYSEFENEMGTLITSWGSIEEDSYSVANDSTVIYKTRQNRWIGVSIEEGVELRTLSDDRYIVVNTTSFWNGYDSVLNKKVHLFSDYNGRCYFGNPTRTSMNGNLIRTTTTASGINVYFATSRSGVFSRLLGYNTVARCNTNLVNLEKCICPEDQDVDGVAVYFNAYSVTSAPRYRFHISPYTIETKYEKFEYLGTTYNLGTSSVVNNISVFASITKGIGNTGTIQDDMYSYQQYWVTSGNPFGTLGYSGSTETYGVQAMFVLQGQFYGVMNDKIYSLIYSAGTISERDAIIDCKGMKFVGNNPMVAFFYSPNQRAFYSFTGDADLHQIYAASKFDKVLYQNDNIYFYDEMSQSIFIPTDKGLLVFGPKSSYIITDYKNVSNVQTSVDGITHITDNGNTYNMVYYPTDGYEAIPLHIETTYWGEGNNEICSIDRYQITLFDYSNTSPKSYIELGVQSITDMVTKSEIKKFEITPKMWDPKSHSVIINYVPGIIQGQGLKLFATTPEIISSITTHTMDRSTSQLSKHTI